MATYHEILHSRDGASTGLGATDEPMIVRVKLEDSDLIEGRDGSVTIPDPRRLIMQNYAPAMYGASAPWDDTAVARQWTIQERLGPMMFDVAVRFFRFSTPYYGPVGRWSIAVRGATLIQHVRTAFPVLNVNATLNSLGMPYYEVDGIPVLRNESVDIGAMKYRSDTSGSFQAVIDGITKKLKPSDLRDGLGYEYEIPALAVTARRTVGNFSISGIGDLAFYQKAVNDREFWGADRYHVRCEDVSVEEISMEIPGQRIQGAAWSITVQFLWSAIPLYPLILNGLYVDDDGNEALVYHVDRPQVPVFEAWNLPHRMNMDALMAKLSVNG